MYARSSGCRVAPNCASACALTSLAIKLETPVALTSKSPLMLSSLLNCMFQRYKAPMKGFVTPSSQFATKSFRCVLACAISIDSPEAVPAAPFWGLSP